MRVRRVMLIDTPVLFCYFVHAVYELHVTPLIRFLLLTDPMWSQQALQNVSGDEHSVYDQRRASSASETDEVRCNCSIKNITWNKY